MLIKRVLKVLKMMMLIKHVLKLIKRVKNDMLIKRGEEC